MVGVSTPGMAALLPPCPPDKGWARLGWCAWPPFKGWAGLGSGQATSGPVHPAGLCSAAGKAPQLSVTQAALLSSGPRSCSTQLGGVEGCQSRGIWLGGVEPWSRPPPGSLAGVMGLSGGRAILCRGAPQVVYMLTMSSE